jgi:hypothetical protein
LHSVVNTSAELGERREDRTWMFFQPIPAKPVQQQVSPSATSIADRFAESVRYAGTRVTQFGEGAAAGDDL